jgi:catechol-2,3-dioxygenase
MMKPSIAGPNFLPIGESPMLYGFENLLFPDRRTASEISNRAGYLQYRMTGARREVQSLNSFLEDAEGICIEAAKPLDLPGPKTRVRNR